MTSSTKRKYITHYIVVRGGPSYIHGYTRIEKFMKFGRVVFEIYERTDTQAGIQTCSSQYLASLPGGGAKELASEDGKNNQQRSKKVLL